jgi:excinuclease UvrABC nuclease subunit
MVELAIPQDSTDLDQLLESLPNRPAVFLLWPRTGMPELGRTNVLRKRIKRALGSLGGVIERVEYQFTGSRLAAQFLLLELARKHLGAGYRKEIRLRLPPYIKLILSNQFPRTQLTTHLGRTSAVYFGPFRNRGTAARFESEFLDLFQLRRCQEDLEPRPDHPGCIYGEMGRCLRPCQQAVGVDEYRGEAERVAEFLRTDGKSLAAPAESARERLSSETDFEGAALMHQRVERIHEVLGLRDELARAVDRLSVITITSGVNPNTVELGWMRDGAWQGFSQLDFASADGTSVSLDSRLRDLALNLPCRAASGIERMEQIAVLARWAYSGWCDGEVLPVDDWAKIPYRKLVNAVSRIAHGQLPHRPSTRS